jgi:hypothetical protein
MRIGEFHRNFTFTLVFYIKITVNWINSLMNKKSSKIPHPFLLMLKIVDYKNEHEINSFECIVVSKEKYRKKAKLTYLSF